MTAARIQTLSVSEVAFILRARLGPMRNWTNFLTDNIRGCQSVAGLTLMPCGRRHDGKGYRPIYDLADVTAFIEAVKVAVPSAGRVPVRIMALLVDKARNWRINKFDEGGNPVAALRRSLAICGA